MAGSESLRAWLASLFAENGGAIPFERLMREALTHPEFGYYTAHIGAVGGTRGDFATSPTLSVLLGRAIAAWAREEARALRGAPGDFSLIEIGAGDGSLMGDVLASFSWRERLRTRTAIVEVSPILRAHQRDTLRRYRSRIGWFDSVEPALRQAEGRALVFSNELVDAFPVILIEGSNEVFVEFDPGRGIRETLRPLAESRPDLDPGCFSALPVDWPDGQRLEWHDAYRRWQGEWLPHLKRGSVLTIDYGGTAAEIYGKRPGGSLRAYFRHQRLTGPGIYRMFGRQDLTADVCFDDLQAWGEQAGLETVRRQTQANFIRELARPRNPDRESSFLLADNGAGGAFQVLSQRTRFTNPD